MTDTPSILAAEIALIGVIASVTASLILTLLSTKSEIKKIKITLRNQYASTLLEKRLNAYGDCYSILSRFIKRARGFIIADTPLTYSDAQEFQRLISEWDSSNALLLSPNAMDRIYHLREQLKICLDKISNDDVSAALSRDVSDNLAEYSRKLEKALRNDIGIYEIEKHEEKEFVESEEQFQRAVRRRN